MNNARIEKRKRIEYKFGHFWHTELFRRVDNYTSASDGIDALPPTSSVIRGHIHRGAFLVHRACQLLATDNEREARLVPVEHGWEDHDGTLLPSKCLKPLPLGLLIMCKCAGKCDTRRCACRAAGVLCVIFCHGKADKSCNNLQQNTNWHSMMERVN